MHVRSFFDPLVFPISVPFTAPTTSPHSRLSLAPSCNDLKAQRDVADILNDNRRSIDTVHRICARLVEHFSIPIMLLMLTVIGAVASGYQACGIDAAVPVLSFLEKGALTAHKIAREAEGVNLEDLCMRCERHNDTQTDHCLVHSIVKNALCDNLIYCDEAPLLGRIMEGDKYDNETDANPTSQNESHTNPTSISSDSRTALGDENDGRHLCLLSSSHPVTSNDHQSRRSSANAMLSQSDLKKPIHQLLPILLNTSPRVTPLTPSSASPHTSFNPTVWGKDKVTRERMLQTRHWVHSLALELLDMWPMSVVCELSKAALGGCLMVHALQYAGLSMVYRVFHEPTKGVE
eukprot:GHVN01058071.1.p3 GENE.GHVN01058071.1~~GHVN01058071.1.p3  ORF type:complete len:348 (+),score=59.55 GHVN01058071.1:2822-3865(+)